MTKNSEKKPVALPDHRSAQLVDPAMFHVDQDRPPAPSLRTDPLLVVLSLAGLDADSLPEPRSVSLDRRLWQDLIEMSSHWGFGWSNNHQSPTAARAFAQAIRAALRFLASHAGKERLAAFYRPFVENAGAREAVKTVVALCERGRAVRLVEEAR